MEDDKPLGLIEGQTVCLDKGQVWALAMAYIAAAGEKGLSLEGALEKAARRLFERAKGPEREPFVLDNEQDEGDRTYVEIAVRSFDTDPILVESTRKEGKLVSGYEILLDGK